MRPNTLRTIIRRQRRFSATAGRRWHDFARTQRGGYTDGRGAEVMTTMNPPATVTPEDLLTMPDAVNYELVDGRLVERHMGMESSGIGWRIAGLLFMFLRNH